MTPFHFLRTFRFRELGAGFVLLVCLSLARLSLAEDRVSFSRDIRPILADTCFKCHGPDEEHRAADLRFDVKESVFDDTDAVTPGDLDKSELYQRITSDDESTLMPPADSGRKLTEEQKDLLKRWIEQGAKWEGHWSFIAPTKPALPKTKDNDWAENEIDLFILNRLEQKSLPHASRSDRRTLIRRVTFDLTGLPPTTALMERYANSKGTDWYEQLVDNLLSSEQYGEHMSRFWLDAARYGDTHGLHLDNYREFWPYRDWVINAFNENKSFRDFGIEQLAGDLLENSTNDQKIATGFNRAHVTTAEGGSIKEEVYVRNVVDRTSTTGTVFMGLTVGCAQCHDHKFDPISQKEFYQLFAFFNSLDADPMDGNKKDHAPVLRVMSDESKTELVQLEAVAKEKKLAVEKMLEEYVYVDPEEEKPKDGEETEEIDVATRADKEPIEYIWVDDEIPSGSKPSGTWKFIETDIVAPLSGKKVHEAKAKEFAQHLFENTPTPVTVSEGDTLFAHVYIDPENVPSEIMLQWNDGNWEHRAYWGENKINWGTDKTPSRFYKGPIPKTGEWIRMEVKAEEIGFKNVTEVRSMAFSQHGGHLYWDKSGVVSKFDQVANLKSLSKWIQNQRMRKGKGLPNPIKGLINRPIEKLTDGKFSDDEMKKIRVHYLQNVNPESKETLKQPLQAAKEAADAVNKLRSSFPTTLIWKEKSEPKKSFVLLRGEYDQKGDEVPRALPAALPTMPEGAEANRLGLARWLFAENHPLTSRVTVNRFWQQVFGTGIVKTTEDFGAQGEIPSHPELLDWLAVDFMEHDWDVRRLMKQMVMSATYRQSSAADAKRLAADPENRLYSRGPRYRLDAEMLRDQALTVSGLLCEKTGGPSVKPPQPDGLWFAVGYSGSNTVRFKQDQGHEKVHRRSLYTFWKRTAPPPQMNTFDAPSRESCSVRRERTNTPLQALLLMNDPQYVEAARHLAATTLNWSQRQIEKDELFDRDPRSLNFMFQRALGREPNKAESKLLAETLAWNRKSFESNVEEANKLIAIGESDVDKDLAAAELASWTMIANLIMNMDEFVTKN